MTVGVVQQVGTELDNLDFGGNLHTSHTVTLPGAPTPGNLLVAVAVFSNMSDGGVTPIKITTPTGWTARAEKYGDLGFTGLAVLVASKVVCPGESASLTLVADWAGHAAPGSQPFRHSNVHLFEFNGGWGGASAVLREGFGDTPTGNGATHHFPAITPTAGAEALLIAHIANENAYGVTSGPGGGYASQLSTTSNDGASTNWLGYSQHIASAAGSYGPQTLTYASSCVSVAVQFWVKAAFDSAPCLGTVADFTGTPTAGLGPLSVAFTDASTNTPTSWLWDFGDGATSTSQNPTHVYASPGYYTVSLQATNAGGTDTETKVAYIHVTAAFTDEVYRLIPPGDDIEFVGTLTTARDKTIRPIRNDTGTGQFTINRYSPEATAAILTQGNLVRTIIPAIDGDAIFAWFMENGLDQLVATTERGGEDITIGGRGVLSYWDRAVWLSEKFVIPWWDSAWGTPPAGARGHVTFAAGTYRRYTIAGGVITGYTNFTTAGFEAYFDARQTYQWPSASSKRFLVHIMAGETNAGWYVHPHQDGVVETLPSQTVGTSSSVLLSDISADTPGAILHHLYLEGTDPARPVQPIPLMTIDFTATHDSNGDPWSTTDALAGLTAELGDTYLDTIMQLISTGVIDVEMTPDLLMRAFNSLGRDLTGTAFGAGKVRFVKGVNIADELRRERQDNPVATFIQVVGTDNVTATAELPDTASRVARETSTTGESADEAVLAAIGLAELEARLVASDAIGFRVKVGNDEAAGLYLPGPPGTANGKWWMGDRTTLHTGTGDQDFDQAEQRVFAATITEGPAGALVVLPEVGSVLGEAERRLYALRARARRSSTALAERSLDSDTAVAETAHPDLSVHDALGLATDAELAARVGVPTAPLTIRYTFSATTTDSDPGAGNLRLSNATQASAVTCRADLTDSDGVDVTAILDAIAAANGPNGNLGLIRLQKRDDPTKWLLATMSASASPSGYRNLTIANIAKSSNSPFANGDLILLSFTPLFTNPATTAGDLLVAGANGVLGRVAKGTDGYVWTMDPATHLPIWAAATGGGAALTVEEADGSPTDAAITKIVFPNGTIAIAAHVATYTPSAAPAAPVPTILNSASVANTQIQNKTLTIPAAASGSRIILAVGLLNRAVSSVTCTNVTWTLIKTQTNGAAHAELWVGVVAGGASGTTITINTPSNDWINAEAVEVANALTPTMGANTSGATTTGTGTVTRIGLTTATPGRLIVGVWAMNNAAGEWAQFLGMSCFSPDPAAWPAALVVTYVRESTIYFGSGSAAAGNLVALLMAELT